MKPPTRTRRRVSIIRLAACTCVLVALVLVTSAILVPAARMTIARSLALVWLERAGIEADLGFSRVDLEGVSGWIRLGPEDRPDLRVRRFDMGVELRRTRSGLRVAVRATDIRLVEPVIALELSGGRLRTGAVDRLLQALPEQPGVSMPPLVIDDGRGEIATSMGTVGVRGDAELHDGRLVWARGALDPAHVVVADMALAYGGGTLELHVVDGALRVQGSLGDIALAAPGVRLDDGHAEIDVDGLPSDLSAMVQRARVTMGARLRGGRIEVQGFTGSGAEIELSIDGEASRRGETLALLGRVRGRGRARSLEGDSLDVHGLAFEFDLAKVQVAGSTTRVDWSAGGRAFVHGADARLGATSAQGVLLDVTTHVVAPNRGAPHVGLRTLARIDHLRHGELALEGVRGAFDAGVWEGADRRIDMRGALSSSGGSWPLLGSIRSGDPPELVALKHSLDDLRVEVPAIGVNMLGSNHVIELDEPVSITPSFGGRMVLSTRADRPFYESRGSERGGAFDLVTSGGAFPRARVQVPSYTLVDAGPELHVEGRTALNVAMSAGPLRNVTVDAAGAFTRADGALRFSGSRCARLSARHIEGAVTDLRGRLCPGGRPLWISDAEGWRVHGVADDVQGNATSLGLRVHGGHGPVRASGGAGSLVLSADVAGAHVVDERDRVRPVEATGRVELSDRRWTAHLDLEARGQHVARLEAHHDAEDRSGMLHVDARGMQLTPDGLQPSDFSSTAERLLGSPVTGTLDLTGRFDWGATGTTSRGRVRARDLAFTTPAGAVSGLAADFELTSLAPLTTAPGQIVTIERLDGPLGVENGRAEVELTADTVDVRRGSFDALKGRVRLSALSIPRTGDGTWEGAARLEALELGELLEGTSVGEKLQIEAKIDGMLPFSYGAEGFRVSGGHVLAVAPGRLSIEPDALSDVSAAGGPTSEATAGGPAGFAQQAMQHLAFDRLEASVRSRPGGRLAVTFHVRGHHDPPERKELAVTWRDLIRRRFLDEELPLPTGTQIDLTLDTHWNLDDLLRALALPQLQPQPRSVSMQRSDRRITDR